MLRKTTAPGLNRNAIQTNHDAYIEPDAMIRTACSLEGHDIDREILPLVLALRSNPAILTSRSSSGHGRGDASVDLAVKGLPGLRLFVEAINQVDVKLKAAAFLDVRLDWFHLVPTACDFGRYPDWVMLSLYIAAAVGRGPSGKLLKRIADAFRRELAPTERQGDLP